MEALTVLLIVGLGNPGKEYQDTRHNAGFMAIETIAEQYGFSGPQTKFHGEFYQGEVDGVKVYAIKPTTFMNRSGISVAEVASFYKIPPENIIVFYDEIDLVPGKLRIKQGGGAAGHNGIRSIDSHIGNNYFRVRIGIGHPGNRDKVSGYVLGKFSEDERIVINNSLSALSESFNILAAGDYEKFMSKVSLLTQPEDKKTKEE